DQTRQLAVLPKYQPTLKDMQCAALTNKARIEFLSAFEKCVAGRFVRCRIRNARIVRHRKHQLQRRSARKTTPRLRKSFRVDAAHFRSKDVAKRIQMMDTHAPKYAVGKLGERIGKAVKWTVVVTINHPDSSEQTFVN